MPDHDGRPPESLRDLSLSLNNVGRVAEARGDWSQAEALYREGLGIRRTLAEVTLEVMPVSR